MSRHPVFFVNPNSTVTVTAAIDRSIEPWRAAGGLELRCVTLEDGPKEIVSQRDADAATPLVASFIERHQDRASGFVISCFSDPGIRAARETTRLPVVGFGEAGLLAALGVGYKVGIVAISSRAIPRHLHYWRGLGLEHRVAAERAIELQVADSGNPALALKAMSAAARRLRDEDGADVILLGCAGMGALRETLQAQLGISVVDPCQAAAAMVLLQTLPPA